MLWTRRTGFHHKDQGMSQFLHSQSDSHGHKPPKPITNPLLIGLNKKGLSDYDSVRSPTSPLEFRIYPNKTVPFIRSLRSSSSQNGHHLNCLGPAKVGLSIVDSLDDDRHLSRDVVFGAGMRIKSPMNQDKSPEFLQEPESLLDGFPVFRATQKIKNATSGVIFEIGDPFEPEPRGLKHRSYSLGSCRSLSAGSGLALTGTNSISESDCLRKTRVLSRSKLGGECNNSGNFLDMKLRSKSGSIGPDAGLLGSSSARDIELSEDYTCIISHGPNPKTTHIYGDQILECHDNGYKGLHGHKEIHISTELDTPFPSDDFLSFCYFCNKKLEDGEDIYMYRGEKAFCSSECRSEEMLLDDDLDEDLTTIEYPKKL